MLSSHLRLGLPMLATCPAFSTIRLPPF
jgi:hypothetical protein